MKPMEQNKLKCRILCLELAWVIVKPMEQNKLELRSKNYVTGAILAASPFTRIIVKPMEQNK